MSLPPSLVAVLTLLVGTAAPAQPHAGRPREEKRVILLKGLEAPAVQPLRVAPKVVTLVLFDMPVLRESVDTEALKRFFTRLEVNESSLVLKPAAALSPGAQPRLKVRFVGGGEPRGMEFELATDPDVVDTQVEVLREEPEEARLRAALTALQGHCAATEAGLAPLRARCALAGLAGLFVSGEMDPEKGVQVHFPAKQQATVQGVMEEWSATIYRTGDTVVVGLKLENPPDQAPWVAAPARLTRLGVDGQPLGETRQLPVTLERGPVGPGESARVAVQWEEPPGEPAPMVRLEVLDAAGRGLRWERLPVLPPVVEPLPAAPHERGRREAP